MNILPIPFGTKGRGILESLRKRLDLGKIAISPQKHNELLTEMRIAQSDEEMCLIKKEQHYSCSSGRFRFITPLYGRYSITKVIMVMIIII
jgi:hypothetical protein